MEFGWPLPLLLLGAGGLLGAGAALIYLPAGLLVGGSALAAVALVCIDVGKGRKP